MTFTRNLTSAEVARMYFIIEEAKETVSKFFQKEQLSYSDFISF